MWRHGRRAATAAAGGGRPPAFGPTRYEARNTVEHGFNKVQQHRAVATRCDKRERIYQGTFDVASIRTWLHDPITGSTGHFWALFLACSSGFGALCVVSGSAVCDLPPVDRTLELIGECPRDRSNDEPVGSSRRSSSGMPWSWC